MMKITVEPGDSLWSLAERHLGDPMRWTEIWQMNRDTILSEQRCRGVEPPRGPNLIYAGTKLSLPLSLENGWRPIKTAPTDGTPVLVWWPQNQSIRFYLESVERPTIARFHDGAWNGTEEPFVTHDGPTHWMPLPARPAR